MAFKLPRLQTALAIVDSMGRPVNSFLRLFNVEFAQRIEEQEARQDETDARLQEQIDRINRILAGTEQFSAVNVGGTIVAENAGLADDIVTTSAVRTAAINQGLVAVTQTAITVLANESTIIQSITLDVLDGEVLDIFGQATIKMNPPYGSANIVVALTWKRGATLLDGNGYAASAETGDITNPFTFQTVSVPVSCLDVPGAGTWTYDLYAEMGVSGSIEVSRRTGRITTLKKAGT